MERKLKRELLLRNIYVIAKQKIYRNEKLQYRVVFKMENIILMLEPINFELS